MDNWCVRRRSIPLSASCGSLCCLCSLLHDSFAAVYSMLAALRNGLSSYQQVLSSQLAGSCSRRLSQTGPCSR